MTFLYALFSSQPGGFSSSSFSDIAVGVAGLMMLSACGGGQMGASSPGPTTPAPQSACAVVPLQFAVGPSVGVAPFPELAQEPPPDPGSTSAGSVCFSSPG